MEKKQHNTIIRLLQENKFSLAEAFNAAFCCLASTLFMGGDIPPGTARLITLFADLCADGEPCEVGICLGGSTENVKPNVMVRQILSQWQKLGDDYRTYVILSVLARDINGLRDDIEAQAHFTAILAEVCGDSHT